MNRRDRRIVVGWRFLLILAFIVSVPPNALPDTPHPFGSPFYTSAASTSPLDGWFVWSPTPLQVATWDIRDAGGYLTGAPLFYCPDLVAPGQPVQPSAAGSGNEAGKVLWRGRPFRDPWTGLADLSLVAPWKIGTIRVASPGMIGGVAASGGVIELQPAEPEPITPITMLAHREGFYDFAPVEFIHGRPVSATTSLTLSGYFPSSAGRFSHSTFSGNALGGQVTRRFDSSHLKVAYQLIDFRSEIPFSDSVRTVGRSDLDVSYRRSSQNESAWEIGGYQTEQRLHWNGRGYSAGESGITSRVYWGDKWGGYLRLSELAGRRISVHRQTEFEGTLGFRTVSGAWSASAAAGGSGWLKQGLNPMLNLAGAWQSPGLGKVIIEGQRLWQVWSLEMLSAAAENNSSDPADSLLFLTELDSLPNRSPVTTGRIGWNWETPAGLLSASAFIREARRPLAWRLIPGLEGAAATVGRTIVDRSIIKGWEGSWSLDKSPYRALVNAAGFDRQMTGDGAGFMAPEPSFRLYAEVGWHRQFYNGAFETDVLLSGRYFNAFYSPGPNEWLKMGGAYPLGFQASFRIFKFNFYWGLHNWNSFQYFLVPGYKALHKEEYFGINWVLQD